MSKKRGPYQSKQRRLVVQHLKLWHNEFLSANEVQQRLLQAGLKVGLTTIYRTLDLLENSGAVVKVPGIDGLSARYRYIAHASEELTPYGKLQCRSCGISLKLDCDRLEEFFRHIEKEHLFQINRNQTLFYGRCESCQSET